MKFISYRILKTGLGASIAMIVATQLGLEYAISAGIITILSIQNTKRQTFKIALERIITFIIALFISSIIFRMLGYNAIAFGIFLLIFISMAIKFNLEQGIVVNSVLITHFLAQKTINLFWIRNELEIMFIGIGVALFLNFYMPSIEGQIRQDQIYIEENIKKILLQMSNALKRNDVLINEENVFNELQSTLQKARELAYNNLNNYFLLDTSYYVQYMEIKIQQFEILKRMREHFQRFFIAYEQTIMIANFTEKVAESLYDESITKNLLREADTLRGEVQKMPLPITREEFENRAMLFQFFNDLEQFLITSTEFKRRVITC